jgi:hypothetical protein
MDEGKHGNENIRGFGVWDLAGSMNHDAGEVFLGALWGNRLQRGIHQSCYTSILKTFLGEELIHNDGRIPSGESWRRREMTRVSTPDCAHGLGNYAVRARLSLNLQLIKMRCDIKYTTHACG